MSRPEHFVRMKQLMKEAYGQEPDVMGQHRFAIEYLCNELSITDENSMLLERRIAVLEGKAVGDTPPTSIVQDAEARKYRELKDALYFAIYEAVSQGNGATAWKVFGRALAAERNKALEEAAQRIERLGYFMDGDGDSIRAQGASAIRALRTPEQA